MVLISSYKRKQSSPINYFVFLNRVSIIVIVLLALLLYSHLTDRETPVIGLASYYSDNFEGLETASGEPYDSSKFTAASLDLPFGTRVLVTRLKNDKQVLVRINDRGPYEEGRIIDLSYAAAEKLGMIRKGVARVSLTVLKKKN